MRDIYLKVTLSEEGYYSLRQAVRQAQEANSTESFKFSFSFDKKRMNNEHDLMPRKGTMTIDYGSDYSWRRIIRKHVVHYPSFLFDPTEDTLKNHIGERVRVGRKKNLLLDGGIRTPVPLLTPIGLGCKPNPRAGSLRAFHPPKRSSKKPASKKSKVKSKK